MSVSLLVKRGVSNVEIARLLDVTQGKGRCQRKRLEEGTMYGRSKQAFLAEPFRPVSDEYLQSDGGETPSNVKALFEHLVAEHNTWAPSGTCSVA